MWGLLSTLNGPDPLLDAVPANGSDGPHCLPVPLCLKRMQVLQGNQVHGCCGSQLYLYRHFQGPTYICTGGYIKKLCTGYPSFLKLAIERRHS